MVFAGDGEVLPSVRADSKWLLVSPKFVKPTNFHCNDQMPDPLAHTFDQLRWQHTFLTQGNCQIWLHF